MSITSYPQVNIPPVGAYGKVLISDGAKATWDYSGQTLISSVTSNGVSSITFSNIPTGFKHLRIIGVWYPSTNGSQLSLGINNSTVIGSAYIYHNGTNVWAGATNSNCYIIGNGYSAGATFDALIGDTSATSGNRTFHSIGGNGGGNYGITFGSGNWSVTSATTTITLSGTSSGNYRVSLYGLP